MSDNDYAKMKLSELRKVVREEHKKTAVPVGKMPRHVLLAEMDRIAATGSFKTAVRPTEAKVVKQVVEQSKPSQAPAKILPKPKQVPKKPSVQGVENKEPIAVANKDVSVGKENVAMGRLIKGSEEARQFMAKIRAVRKTKKEQVD
jgi:hypothetical protein